MVPRRTPIPGRQHPLFTPQHGISHPCGQLLRFLRLGAAGDSFKGPVARLAAAAPRHPAFVGPLLVRRGLLARKPQ